jgi:large repetitive protein
MRIFQHGFSAITLIGGLLLTTLLSACGGGGNAPAAAAINCLADGSIFGAWQSVFGGGGCVAVITSNGKKILHENPRVAMTPAQTFSSLVVGPTLSAPFTFQGQLLTVRQQRTGSLPNPWEVAWIIWNYTDNQHFYYFIPKTNGWELGKADPVFPGGQRFIQLISKPVFAPGVWHSFNVTHSLNNTMTISIDNVLITSFTDTPCVTGNPTLAACPAGAAPPYSAGKIGLYNEDSEVNFSDIALMNTDVVTAATPINLINFP